MNSVKYVTVKKSQKANKNKWITAFTLQWRIQGKGLGGPGPPLCEDQTEAVGPKNFFGIPPPLSQGLDDRLSSPPPPLCLYVGFTLIANAWFYFFNLFFWTTLIINVSVKEDNFHFKQAFIWWVITNVSLFHAVYLTAEFIEKNKWLRVAFNWIALPKVCLIQCVSVICWGDHVRPLLLKVAKFILPSSVAYVKVVIQNMDCRLLKSETFNRRL